MFNRVNFMASKAGSATFLKAGELEATKDGDLEFILGTEEIYRLTPESQCSEANPPVFRKNLVEVPEVAMDLKGEIVQVAQLEFGVITAGDAGASDLPTQKTATGINDIARSGNSLQNRTGDLHARAFTEILELCTEIALENMAPMEAFVVDDEDTLATLNREEIRALPRDVRLLLTKARSAESLERNKQATDLVLQYVALPKWQQKIVRSFFIAQLRALDVQDADEHLPEPTDAEIQAEAQAAQQSQQKPPTDMMSIAYKDAPPPIQRQMETAMGMQPLTPEQEQQVTQQSVQAQQTPTPPHHLKVVPNVPA